MVHIYIGTADEATTLSEYTEKQFDAHIGYKMCNKGDCWHVYICHKAHSLSMHQTVLLLYC